MTTYHYKMEMSTLHTLTRALNMTAVNNSALNMTALNNSALNMTVLSNSKLDTYPLKHKEGTKGERKREKRGEK